MTDKNQALKFGLELNASLKASEASKAGHVPNRPPGIELLPATSLLNELRDGAPATSFNAESQ